MDVKLIKQNIKKYLVKKNAYLTIGGQFNLQSQIESVSYFDFIGDTIVSLDKNQKIINNNDFPNISSTLPKTYLIINLLLILLLRLIPQSNNLIIFLSPKFTLIRTSYLCDLEVALL